MAVSTYDGVTLVVDQGDEITEIAAVAVGQGRTVEAERKGAELTGRRAAAGIDVVLASSITGTVESKVVPKVA